MRINLGKFVAGLSVGVLLAAGIGTFTAVQDGIMADQAAAIAKRKAEIADAQAEDEREFLYIQLDMVGQTVLKGRVHRLQRRIDGSLCFRPIAGFPVDHEQEMCTKAIQYILTEFPR